MKCKNCGKHKGTQKWTGEGGYLAFTHGMYSMWCKCCCLKYQLKYAKDLAKQIPKLEKELKKSKCEDMKV